MRGRKIRQMIDRVDEAVIRAQAQIQECLDDMTVASLGELCLLLRGAYFEVCDHFAVYRAARPIDSAEIARYTIRVAKVAEEFFDSLSVDDQDRDFVELCVCSLQEKSAIFQSVFLDADEESSDSESGTLWLDRIIAGEFDHERHGTICFSLESANVARESENLPKFFTVADI